MLVFLYHFSSLPLLCGGCCLIKYLDELYVYSYIACVAIFLLFLVGTNLVSRAEEQERASVVRRVNRTDLVVQASLMSGFVLVAILGWFT